jgi:hypothetical protein
VGAVFRPENGTSNDAASFSLVQGELAACPMLAAFDQALGLRACLRAAAGALLAQTEGPSALDPVRPAVQLGAGLELAWQVGAAAMHVGASAAAPLIRDRFFLLGASGRNEVFRMAPVIGEAYLAALVDLL